MAAGQATAIVTGANHGIGAATAVALAQRGCAVLCTYLRVQDEDDPGTPQAYRDHRAGNAAAVVAQIESAGGRAVAIEADLSDPATPAALFDAAEEQLGPVDILVNNATGWLADTFKPAAADRLGRQLHAGHGGYLAAAVRRRRDGRGAADRRVRPPARGAGCDLGPDHRAHLRRRPRLP